MDGKYSDVVRFGRTEDKNGGVGNVGTDLESLATGRQAQPVDAEFESGLGGRFQTVPVGVGLKRQEYLRAFGKHLPQGFDIVAKSVQVNFSP